MDILVSYCEEWETPLRTSKHHFIEGLAREGNRVLYIETPVSLFHLILSPKNFFNRIRNKVFFRPVQVENNVWTLSLITPIPFFKGFGPLFDSELMNHAQQLFSYLFIKRSLKKLDFGEFHMITYLPLIYPLLSRLQPIRNLYHIVDEWRGLANLPITVSKLIIKYFKYSDITVVTSQSLYDRYKPFSKEIRLLRHGTDIKLFNKVFASEVQVAEELIELSGKKLGYYGALHKLDYELIFEVSSELRDLNFIFIGPTSGPQGLKKQLKLPLNCYVWDSWNRDKLPSFLAGLDVFWMPFLDNELTQFMSPIKIYEVMSAGLPIVSTNLQETRLVGGNLNKYANNNEEHIKFINEFIHSPSYELSKKRVEYTKNFDWSQRREIFFNYLVGEKTN